MRHHFRGLLGIVFAVLLIFITFVTSFEAVTYWTPNFYRDEFEHYQVLDDMQAWMGDEMTMDDLCDVMHQTMVYLRGDRENLIVETTINGGTTEFYNENEKSHMADVRQLFVICLVVRALAILSCLAIAGFLTNCCVESTMRSAYERGFRVVTLTDCTATLSPEEQSAAVTKNFPMFSRPMDHARFLGELGGAA